MAFQYHAINRAGAKVKGVLRAEDQSEAYRQVRAAGLQPLRIKTMAGTRRRRKRITLKDIAHMTYQFSVLMEARIPVVDGLRSIAEQESNARLGEIMMQAAKQIEAGQSITEALAAHRDVFGDIYIEMIRSAEITGNMTAMLGNLADMLERQYEMNKTVKGALVYPLCVVGALTLAVGFLTMFVVPKFATMFASRGIDLPLPTQLLVGFSDFMRSYWYIVLALALAGVFAIRTAWRKPASRQKIDTWLHMIPFLRDMLKGVAVSRFTHVLGLSIQSGVSLLDGLSMAGASSGRPLMVEDAEKMRDQVNLGGRMADVLLTCSYLPPFTKRMLSAGEEAAG
jgi:type IV pilus assembly protein PilC